MKKIFIVYFTLNLFLLTACATDLKAPCDQYASFCGPKKSINSGVN